MMVEHQMMTKIYKDIHKEIKEKNKQIQDLQDWMTRLAQAKNFMISRVNIQGETIEEKI